MRNLKKTYKEKIADNRCDWSSMSEILRKSLIGARYVTPRPPSFWQASGLVQVIARNGRSHSWCSLAVIAQGSTVVASKSEKVSCFNFEPSFTRIQRCCIKRIRIFKPFGFGVILSYLRLLLMLSFKMRYICFHFNKKIPLCEYF